MLWSLTTISSNADFSSAASVAASVVDDGQLGDFSSLSVILLALLLSAIFLGLSLAFLKHR